MYYDVKSAQYCDSYKIRVTFEDGKGGVVDFQPYLQKGDIIIFDDFFTFTKTTHEFKAFCDFFELFKMEYVPLFKCRYGHYVIEMM